MFCPAGYHPAAALWIEFVEARLESIYATSVAHYNSVDFHAGFVRGSPLDICEHYFLKTLATVGFHLAAPTGQVVRIHILMRDGHDNLLTVLDPYGSAWSKTAMMVEAEKTEVQDVALPSGFTSWEHEAHDHDAWAIAYKSERAFPKGVVLAPYADLQHHTFPFHFERHSYLITGHVPKFAFASSLSPNVRPILENFAGWSLCLDDQTYHSEWMDYLFTRKQLYPKGGVDASLSSGGRPRLTEAYAAFEAMGFDKGDLSWREVGDRIEGITGHNPSARALRNWRDDFFAKDSDGD